MGSRKRGLRKHGSVGLRKIEWLEPRCVLSAAHFALPTTASHSFASQPNGSNWGEFSWNGGQSNSVQADDWSGFAVSNSQNGLDRDGFDGQAGQALSDRFDSGGGTTSWDTTTFDIRQPSSSGSFTYDSGDHDGFGDSRFRSSSFGGSDTGSLGFAQPVSSQPINLSSPIASPPTSSLTSSLSSDAGSSLGSSCTTSDSASDSPTTSSLSSIATTGDGWTTTAGSVLGSVVTSTTSSGDFGGTIGNQLSGLGSLGGQLSGIGSLAGGQLGGPGGGPLGLGSLGGLGPIGEIASLGPPGPMPGGIIGSLVSTSTGAIGALESTVSSTIPVLDIGHTKPTDPVTSLISPLLGLNVSVSANLDSASISVSTVQHAQATPTAATTSHSTVAQSSAVVSSAQLPAAIPYTASATVVVNGGELPNIPLPMSARSADAAASKGASTVGSRQLAVVHGDARAAIAADQALLLSQHEAPMATLPVSVAAVDRAIQTVMGEIGEVGKGFSHLLGSGHVNAASIAVGVATLGAAAGYYLRRRGSRKAEEIEDEASSSWLFERLQPIPRS
jgi:hypothetical protein